MTARWWAGVPGWRIVAAADPPSHWPQTLLAQAMAHMMAGVPGRSGLSGPVVGQCACLVSGLVRQAAAAAAVCRLNGASRPPSMAADALPPAPPAGLLLPLACPASLSLRAWAPPEGQSWAYRHRRPPPGTCQGHHNRLPASQHLATGLQQRLACPDPRAPAHHPCH